MRFTTIASVLAATSGLVAAAPLEATRDAPLLESAAVTGGAGVEARDDAVTGAVTGGDSLIKAREDAPELESAATTGGLIIRRADAQREDSDVVTGILTGGDSVVKAREDAPELESAAVSGALTGGAIKARDDAQREDSDAVTGILTGGITGVKARNDVPELESAAVSGGIVGAATGGVVKAREDAAREDLEVATAGNLKAREDASELESAAVSGALTGGAIKAREDAAREDLEVATAGNLKAREDAPELESAAVSGALTGGAIKAREDAAREDLEVASAGLLKARQNSCPVTTVGDYVWKITNFIGRKPQGTYFNYIAFDIESTKQGSSLNVHCQATQTQIPDSKFVRCDGSSSFEFAFSNEYNGLILKYGDAPNAMIGTTTVPNNCRAGGSGPDDKVCNGVQDAYMTLLKSPFQYN